VTDSLSPYERFGGHEFFTALVHDFYVGVAQDPVLRPMFPDEDLGPAEERLRMFLEQYWGGPTTYSDERGHPRLRMRHAPYRIDMDAHDRWLDHMGAAVKARDLDPEAEAERRGGLDDGAKGHFEGVGPGAAIDDGAGKPEEQIVVRAAEQRVLAGIAVVTVEVVVARAAIQGEDQLRQRTAFALSQILVTSRRDAQLENRVIGMASYYDIFVRNAFGNYLDILRDVTFHPVMGRYLSHVGNAKARPEINQFPDENYARELMQLFTIGLWQLNPDGTRQLTTGNPIPTYSNTEITQLARVFTGFWFGHHNWGQGGYTEADYAINLSLHANRHDFGPKTLVSGHTIPARAPTPGNARRDVEDALAAGSNDGRVQDVVRGLDDRVEHPRGDVGDALALQFGGDGGNEADLVQHVRTPCAASG
jgi:truncated hemoglobin YjbI